VGSWFKGKLREKRLSGKPKTRRAEGKQRGNEQEDQKYSSVLKGKKKPYSKTLKGKSLEKANRKWRKQTYIQRRNHY